MKVDALGAAVVQRKLSSIFQGVEFILIHKGRKLRCFVSSELLMRAFGAKTACRDSWLEAFDSEQQALLQCALMQHMFSGIHPVLLLDDGATFPSALRTAPSMNEQAQMDSSA